MNVRKIFGVTLLAFFVANALVANAHLLSAYAPHRGDYFRYSETIAVNNGQGSYSGYVDQTQISGMEQMNSVNGSLVSASYDYSLQYSNNQGGSNSSSASGNYTWSANTFTYVNGTDNEVGYAKPTYVWFAMNTSIPVEGTFYVLNTKFTVLSENYSFQLPTEGNNSYVRTIQAEGTGQYQRNDSYGVFDASYTWDEYFDPSTGYIVGYSYIEQDSGQYQGQAGSFTYTDNLYVSTTSYALTPANPPPLSSSTTVKVPPTQSLTTTNGGAASAFEIFGIVVAFVVILIVIGLGVYAATRKRGREGSLPKHPYTPYTPPSSTPKPWESGIDLGSKPPEQVVIRDVAKVNCKYCGTLIPTTADTCPYCGAPRT